jgi:hypothetical protein
MKKQQTMIPETGSSEHFGNVENPSQGAKTAVFRHKATGKIRLDCVGKESVNVVLEASMPDPIAKRFAALPQLSKTALYDLWKQLFNTSPSPKLRRDLMIPILAFRLQEQALGSLSTRTRDRLRHLSQAFERDSDSTIACAPQLRPGTRLVRQWRDQVHLVNVQANSYEYHGARYKNLSEIARLITGTRWSGPLFFGIKKRASWQQT